MAQRNPMNERYTGDGPQGKTRKSASKLKPKTDAASSVHIESKPTTKSERKAAAKKRNAQLAAKEAERKRKAEEREIKARIAAGEEVEEPKKPTVIDGAIGGVKKFFAPPAGSAPRSTNSQNPDTPEYHRAKRLYWILMGVGVVAIMAAFVLNFMMPSVLDGWGMMIPMGVAYAAVIAAIILDYTKVRKMQKEFRRGAESGKGSPKQIKHDQRKKEAAALLEERRKAEKELKRANSKLTFKRNRSDDDAAAGSKTDTDASKEKED